MKPAAPQIVHGPAIAAISFLVLDALQRAELDRGDFFDHVREDVELSRARRGDLLTPVDTLHRAVDALGHALRQCGPDAPSRCAVKSRAAELAALAVRIALEGSPVFPASLPGAGR